MNEKLKPMEVRLLAGGGGSQECSWGSILGGPNTTLRQHCVELLRMSALSFFFVFIVVVAVILIEKS